MVRRDFMKAMLAAGVAPAIVRVENIMRVATPAETRIVTREHISREEFERAIVMSVARSFGIPYTFLAADHEAFAEAQVQCFPEMSRIAEEKHGMLTYTSQHGWNHTRTSRITPCDLAGC